jgi:predicted esterase
MRKLFTLFYLLPQLVVGQNYPAKADSCFKQKDYSCAGTYFDLYLSTRDSSSNGIAFRSAVAWSLAGDKQKALSAVKIYIRNNYLNDKKVFSSELTAEKSFRFLYPEPAWNEMLAGVRAIEKPILDSEMAIARSHQLKQDALEKKKMRFDTDLEATQLYNAIQKYDDFPRIQDSLLSLTIPLIDSQRIAYLLVVPKNYDPHRRYPLLFFLHGAVAMNTGYPLYANTSVIGGWNRFYTRYAGANDVVMVYPNANAEYNWMYPDKGFFMVPAILKQIKQVINIDDDHVFVSGHSNGATGSFSYMLKQPTPFAGFYGFNTRPIVATGGTYLRNALNRSYFNVSTDKDYYYPAGANDSLAVLMKRIGADYSDHRYNGFPHSFPAFNESEEAVRLLFADLIHRKRNSFAGQLYWECDDTSYGRCDWLRIVELDTATAAAAWHTDLNFPILKWNLQRAGGLEERDTVLPAYRFYKKSGAVKAVYRDNVFELSCSRVGSLTVYISPQMVNMKKPIRIIVNEEEKYKGRVVYRKEILRQEFDLSMDRRMLYVDKIEITNIR